MTPRTEQAIYDEMVDDKNSREELVGMNTPSATALWRLIFYVTAKAIHWFENVMAAFQLEMEAVAAAARPLTISWYLYRCFDFQYGDDITFVNEVPGYEVIDPSKRIIARAAVTEDRSTGVISIRVVKEVAGVLQALSGLQLTAFTAYLNKIQGAGDRIVISSLQADLLRIHGTIYYNPLLSLADIQEAVVAAVDGHLAGLEFNGKLSVLKLEDMIQAVTGVEDFELGYQAKQGASAYASFTRQYATVAGYIIMDNSTGNSLLDAVNWVAA